MERIVHRLKITVHTIIDNSTQVRENSTESRKNSTHRLERLVHRLKITYTDRDVNVFIFQKNDRFVMKTTTKNRKRNDRFSKRSFSKTIVFIKFVVSLTIVNYEPSLTIVNDDPSLTIVNEERKPT